MEKNKFYLIGACVVILVVIVLIVMISTNKSGSSIFEVSVSSNSSGGMPEDMTTAPKNVTDTISELESHRSHLSESCIYGAAMMLNDLGDEAKQVIDGERKCIHALVMSIIRERKLNITTQRLAQLEIDEAKQNSSKTSSSQ